MYRVIGIREFKSKKGNDCMVFYCCYEDRYVRGEACKEVFAVKDNLFFIPAVGDCVDFNYDDRGFLKNIVLA